MISQFILILKPFVVIDGVNFITVSDFISDLCSKHFTKYTYISKVTKILVLHYNKKGKQQL